MTSKTILVTGGNSGIGFGLAKSLCRDGHDVIIACRSEEKGKEAVEKILQDNSDAKIMNMKLDLADLDSIRSFVDDFKKSGKPLDVLVNNAGLFMTDDSRCLTKDNFEMTIGTNHLGHFLLNNLLLDDLKSRAREVGEARIVVVSSELHDRNFKFRRVMVREMDIEDFFLEKTGAYKAFQAYKESKLSQVLTGYRLAKMLQDTGVTVNSLSPGFIPETGLGRHSSFFTRFLMRHIIYYILRVRGVSSTLEEGVQRVRTLALDEALKGVTGKYFYRGKESPSSDESYDEEKQKAVWELSARYCRMDGYEPLYCKEN